MVTIRETLVTFAVDDVVDAVTAFVTSILIDCASSNSRAIRRS
jgi:hypothetical protein